MKNYNKETNGIIKEIKDNGSKFSTSIIVEYIVDDIKYELKENLIMKKDKIIKLGFIPIGYKTKSQIEIKTGIVVKVGNNVRIKYDSSNPSDAYLIDNKGVISYE